MMTQATVDLLVPISHAVSPVAGARLPDLRAGAGVGSAVPQLWVVLRSLARHTDTTGYDQLLHLSKVREARTREAVPDC